MLIYPGASYLVKLFKPDSVILIFFFQLPWRLNPSHEEPFNICSLVKQWSLAMGDGLELIIVFFEVLFFSDLYER